MLKIWDLSTRIYHWLQAILFFGLVGSSYGVFPSGMHSRFGVALLVLLVWRLGWGVFGSETARFTQFVKSPKTVMSYLKGEREAGIGHNPMGALMVISLIGALLLQASSGLIMTEMIDGKALLGRSTFKFVEMIHSVNSWLLLALVSIHILVIMMYRMKGNNLIRAMFTGKVKFLGAELSPKFVSQKWALIWLLCSVLSVITLVKLLP